MPRYFTRFQVKKAQASQAEASQAEASQAEASQAQQETHVAKEVKPSTQSFENSQIKKDKMFVAEMLRKTDHAILRIDRIYYAIELFYYLSQHTTLIEVNTAFHHAVKNKIVQLEMEIQDDRCRLAVQQHECQKHESACAMLPSLIQLAKEVALLDHLNHIMKRLKPLIYA